MRSVFCFNGFNQTAIVRRYSAHVKPYVKRLKPLKRKRLRINTIWHNSVSYIFRCNSKSGLNRCTFTKVIAKLKPRFRFFGTACISRAECASIGVGPYACFYLDENARRLCKAIQTRLTHLTCWKPFSENTCIVALQPFNRWRFFITRITTSLLNVVFSTHRSDVRSLARPFASLRHDCTVTK